MQRKKKKKPECNFIGIKNNRLHQKCKECNNDSYKTINELIKKFPNAYQFPNGDINNFVLLLRKSVYPYEYMNCSEKFNKT